MRSNPLHRYGYCIVDSLLHSADTVHLYGSCSHIGGIARQPQPRKTDSVDCMPDTSARCGIGFLRIFRQKLPREQILLPKRLHQLAYPKKTRLRHRIIQAEKVQYPVLLPQIGSIAYKKQQRPTICRYRFRHIDFG